MIVLNEGQTLAVNKMVKFFHDPNQKFFLLTGKGGVGKSTCIQTAVRQMMSESAKELKVCMTAPTNKATKVIREMAAEAGLNVESKTLYALLGLVLDNNDEIRYAKKMKDGSLEDFDLVIVDEVSVVQKALMAHLDSAVANSKTSVIMMGDKAQLPPVKESVSSVFDADMPKMELTQIMRQAEGNPILELAQSIRDCQADPRLTPIYQTSVNSLTGEGIYTMGAEEWIGYVKENFNSDEARSVPNAFRCLAYTNKRVNSLNKMIRHMVIGETETPFIIGERVLTRKPIEDSCSFDRLHTDSEAEVIDIVECSHPLFESTSNQFKVWAMTLKGDDMTIVECFLLHQDSKRDYNTHLNTLGKMAREGSRPWKNFWDFKGAFADLQSVYAMTVHRSQGSTYNNVFVDMRDVYRNPKRLERLQLEYVAVSRASETLVILEK